MIFFFNFLLFRISFKPKSKNKTGEPDCNDASDEENCLSTTLLECPEGEFRCGGNFNHISAAPGSRCILNRFRCDGKLNSNKLNVDSFLLHHNMDNSSNTRILVLFFFNLIFYFFVIFR